jgi:osmotically-inducible protein OsmY
MQNKMHENVNYEVKNGVVTLTGDVNSEHIRTGAEKVASMVPNVKRVVNALRLVKYRKVGSAQ